MDPKSTPPTFAQLVEARLSRRGALLGASAVALLSSLRLSRAESGTGPQTLALSPFSPALSPDHQVAGGYRAQVLLAWGDALSAQGPAFDPARPSRASQERQFGYGNDFLAFFPLPRGSQNSDRGLLFVNHEYTNAPLMFPKELVGTPLATEVELAAHGLSIVELRRIDGDWQVVKDSPYQRRLPAGSARFRLKGPAAGHPRLRTREDPTGTSVIGTLNNCAGGRTPWGTALSGEENVHKYFAGTPAGAEARNHLRLGIGKPEFSFHRHQARFRLDEEPNEPNRFGWVVEVDPYDPGSEPVKRTALGRFCHEGAETVQNGDGHLVVYMGDDARGEYIYRFVSADTVDAKRRENNRDLLDSGRLDVARLDADGNLFWLPLVHGQGPLVEANGFASQADVLLETRRAADLLGATPMDRPEDLEASPITGKVYVALTNNSRRGTEGGPPVDPANPRARNRHGHILELIPPMRAGQPDHGAPVFRWEVFLLAGDPKDQAQGAEYGSSEGAVDWISCPDNLCFDPKGRLWIATDGMEGTSALPDGLFATQTEGEDRARTHRLYAVPLGAELCGPCFTPDGTTLFVAVQHPGEGSTFESPSTRWPDFREDLPPRPAVVAIRRDDGGPIGG